MDTAIEDLKKRLEELPKRGGKRQYTAGVKRSVLELVDRLVADGQSEAVACKAIGVHQATVSEWKRGPRRGRKNTATRRSRVRAVEVVATEPVSASGAMTLVLPGGGRIEGLQLEQVAELVKALR